MILIDNYIPLLRSAIPKFGRYPPDPEQQICIRIGPTIPLMIAAGPGTGKTSTLVLRALRLVFVDNLLPEQIIITTFTNKAADEIRARLIEWGLLLKYHLQQAPPTPLPTGFDTWLGSIDVNRFVTGTLDSICEETLTRYRHPSDPAPVLVESFVADAELRLNGLLPSGANQNPDLDNYLAPFNFGNAVPRNFGEKLRIIRSIIDRFAHDQVDITSYRLAPTHRVARNCIADSAQLYRIYMDNSNKMDFAQLEQLFLQRLSSQRLTRFVNGIRAILVDEYQDTNPLQESIYFQLARQTRASFTIVGDDDQSLYRFRGATVELFRDFVTRFNILVPGYPPVDIKYLTGNYRSTPEIVTFINNFVQTDHCFLPARVQPPKPPIAHQLPSNGIPVLGMFRTSATILADDLVSFLWDVFRGNGRPIQINNQNHILIRNPNGGDFGDCVFLSYTVNEFAIRYGNNPPRHRLPGLIRERLEARGISVFNPRGRALRDTPVVQEILGCMLECIDPSANEQSYLEINNQLRHESIIYLNLWRQAAHSIVASNPSPYALGNFITAWQRRTTQSQMPWPNEWPLLELCFKLITWFPFLHNNPEGQTYLEAVSRCISQAASFSTYRSTIVFTGGNDANSVRRAILDIFSPIADNSIDIDEEIMPHVPRSCLPIMTIHQAKGLEYPLTIVDVSSDFQKNSPMQRFRRFPNEPSTVQNLEDDLAPYCQIGPLRTARSALDRTFDDLKRLYYVAYSRPQSALLLVGLLPCLRHNTTICHVATGWTSDGTWAWRQTVAGQAPTLVQGHPLKLI